MSLTGNALNNSNEKRFKIVYAVTLVIFFAVCTVLYQRMTISYPGVFGTYYSDINVRLAMHEINGGSIYYTYSIFLIPERWFYFVLGKPVGPWCIGVYLSFFTVGTVFILFQLLKKLCPEAKTGLLAFFSYVCIFSIPIIIPPISDRVFSPYAGAVWHNESYLGMRFMALLVILFFFRTNELYLKRFSAKDFVIESLLILFVNWLKPNFIIAFGPAMLIMMIIDIVKAKGKGFFKWMMYGIPVLIGCAILPIQYLILFPSSSGSAAASESSSGVTLIFGDFIVSQKHPVLNIILAFGFTVFMFIIHRKEFIKSKFHQVCCLGWLFSFMEYAFLAEKGIRKGHENFYWGVRFFSLLLFCLSIGYFIKDIIAYRKNKEKADENSDNKKKKAIDLFFVENILVIAHLLSGIYYFVLVLLGARASEL